jgi:hypothetical protein
MTIPEIRARLHELAVTLGCKELHDLAEATRRRSAKKRAASVRQSLTPTLAQNPNMSNREIGNVFNVDGGRVSEAIHRSKGM